MQKIVDACHHDPFSVLGPQRVQNQTLLRVFNPQAERIAVQQTAEPLSRIANSDFFELLTKNLPDNYQLQIDNKDGTGTVTEDPYRFLSLIHI